MLTRLKIHNFKCFDSLSLPLAPLTLLTGFNAAGKSTVLQSILLLAQALRYGGSTVELNLNGSLVRLGTPGEVLNSGSGNVIFSVEDERVDIEWVFQAKDRTRGVSLTVSKVGVKSGDGKREYEKIDSLDMFLPSGCNSDAVQLVERLREMVFLSAVRIGGADAFPYPDEASPVHTDVGVQGEFAPWWFQRFMDEEIDESRCHASDPATTLRRQFNAWAGELFPGAQGNAQLIDKTNLVRLELRIGDIGDWRRPSNIGYGLTYAFPIIVSGLLAKPKQILIIDSPEAHLHPLGQSHMGRFLAKAAAAGVQVIIETHSDHVINGIRLSTQNQTISPDKIAIHFFRPPGDASDVLPRVVSPLIDAQGNLSDWPEGFCDQSEQDMARLAGWA